jgi:hypothetical protein
MDIQKAALLLVFFGAPLVAVVVPIVSIVTLRRHRVSICCIQISCQARRYFVRPLCVHTPPAEPL